MASHGVARTARTRTEEQKLQDLEKIKKYRDLEDQVRANIVQKNFTPEVLQLTSKLLRLNPEYYTIWNDRRRLLIYGLLSRRSDGLWPSKELPNSSLTATTTPSFAASSSSSSTTIQHAREPLTAGKSGTIAEARSGADQAGPGHKGTDHNEEGDGRKAAAEKDLAILQSELAFIVPLLQEAPKCYWIWDYRGWVLQQAIERLGAETARRLWEAELGLASKMLTKDRRNYHAWGYRRQLVAKLESPELDGKSMVESEFEYTTKMIRVDLSNFSAWHNRSRLIPRLLDERGADDLARRNFFDQELGIIRDALNVGPEDQSLWYYHQFLMLNLFEYIGRPTITPNFALEDRVTYATREIDDIKELLEDYDDIKWIYVALMEYTISLCNLEEREPQAEERAFLRIWLSKLRTLDPMREGRWNDVEREYSLRLSSKTLYDGGTDL